MDSNDDSDATEETETEEPPTEKQLTTPEYDERSIEEDEKATIPLGERLAQSAQERESKAATFTQAARARQRAAKQEVAKRLKALRATKITKDDDTKLLSNKGKNKVSKHRPTEASSKRADFYHNLQYSTLNERGTGVDLGAHKFKPRDPRLVPSEDSAQPPPHAEKQFDFLLDMRKAEIKTLQTRIQAWKTTGRKGQSKRRQLGLTDGESSWQADKERLQALQQQVAAYEREQIQKQAQVAVQQQQKQLSERLGKPVYFKRRQVKELTQKARLEQVRQTKGEKAVDKIVTKRRKRIKSRDAKRLAKVEQGQGLRRGAYPK